MKNLLKTTSLRIKISPKKSYFYSIILHSPVQCLSRFSDNCTGQFKSKFTMAKMLAATDFLSLPCATIDWLYYEPDHGKCLALVNWLV